MDLTRTLQPISFFAVFNKQHIQRAHNINENKRQNEKINFLSIDNYVICSYLL